MLSALPGYTPRNTAPVKPYSLSKPQFGNENNANPLVLTADLFYQPAAYRELAVSYLLTPFQKGVSFAALVDKAFLIDLITKMDALKNTQPVEQLATGVQHYARQEGVALDIDKVKTALVTETLAQVLYGFLFNSQATHLYYSNSSLRPTEPAGNLYRGAHATVWQTALNYLGREEASPTERQLLARVQSYADPNQDSKESFVIAVS